WDVVAPEERRPESPRAVAPDEGVDVADVIRLEHDGECRRVRVEPGPDLLRVVGRRERVEHRDLAAGLDARRGDQRPPVVPGRPVGMLEPPDPEARRDVAKLHDGRLEFGGSGQVSTEST